MRPLECQTLVVGAGLLGLATADHLLRRGASSVLLVEREGSPNGGRPGTVAPLVRAGSPELDAAETRTRLLLSSGADYLDTDFLAEGSGYRRVGSLAIPAGDRNSFEAEELAHAAIEERFPGLVAGEDAGHFFAEDGTLDTMGLIPALHARVREQGGRVLCDAELTEIAEDDTGVTFQAGGRPGRAERACLTAGPATPRLLAPLGLRPPWMIEVVHAFRVATEPRPGPVLRLAESRTVLVPLDEREWEIEIAVDAPRSGDPTVDWTLLEEFRTSEAGRLPWIARTEVKRARLIPRLTFDAAEPVHATRGGRVLAAGAFGAHGLGLFAAVAETLAERSLAPPDPLGGILEDPL